MAYQIELSWTPPTGGNVTSQEVQRKTASTSFATIVTLGATANTYTDTNVVEDMLYDYQIVSICSNGATGQSNNDATGFPTCPTLTAGVVDDVRITWNIPALPSNIDTYYKSYDVVERNFPTGGGTIVSTGMIPAANKKGPYQITYANEITGYWYEVRVRVCVEDAICVECTSPIVQA
jgi:hypothetical protein